MAKNTAAPVNLTLPTGRTNQATVAPVSTLRLPDAPSASVPAFTGTAAFEKK